MTETAAQPEPLREPANFPPVQQAYPGGHAAPVGYGQPNGYPPVGYAAGGYNPAPLGFAVGGAPVSSAGKRLGASVLDSILFMFTLGFGWMMWSAIVWSKGTTPGKSLLGMRCVRTVDGQVANWGTMALREIVGKGILGFVTGGITSLISCFMILGAARQGIWDKVASTTVVDDPDGRLLRR